MFTGRLVPIHKKRKATNIRLVFWGSILGPYGENCTEKEKENPTLLSFHVSRGGSNYAKVKFSQALAYSINPLALTYL